MPTTHLHLHRQTLVYLFTALYFSIIHSQVFNAIICIALSSPYAVPALYSSIKTPHLYQCNVLLSSQWPHIRALWMPTVTILTRAFPTLYLIVPQNKALDHRVPSSCGLTDSLTTPLQPHICPCTTCRLSVVLHWGQPLCVSGDIARLTNPGGLGLWKPCLLWRP